MAKTTKELQEERAAAEEVKKTALAELRTIGEAGGDLPEELQTKARSANDDIVRIKEEITGAEKRDKEKAAENAERITEFERSMESNKPDTRHTRESDTHPNPQVREAGVTYVTRDYMGDMAPQVRNLFDEFGYNRRSTEREEEFGKKMFRAGDDDGRKRAHVLDYRALVSRAAPAFQADIGAQGGTGVPDDQRFFGILESRRKMFMGVERVSNVIYTETDGDMPYHLVDTTGNEGETLAETGDSTDYPDYAMIERILKSHRLSSKIIAASNKALRSFSALTEGYIGFLLGESIGRLEARQYAKGTGAGNNQRGIHVALAETILASTFVTDLSPSAGATYAYDLGENEFTGTQFRIPIAMWQDLDPAYWSEAGSIVMSPSFFNLLRAVRDTQNRPIWPEMSYRSQGGMFMWQSHPVVIDVNYDAVNTAAATVDQLIATVGDHMGFRIRKVRGATILRNPYRDVDFKRDSVSFVMNQYCDSNIADPWGLRQISLDTIV